MGQIIKKRNDYISWDEYFMGVSMLSGMRSKDPNTQVGACIVGKDHRILSMGYNGFPNGCSDDLFPWAREGAVLETKYSFVAHSELNAILNSHGVDLKGTTMYCTLFPCNECAKAIVQVGIKRVIYLSMYAHQELVEITNVMFEKAGVECIPFNDKQNFTKQEIQENSDKMLDLVKKFSRKC